MDKPSRAETERTERRRKPGQLRHGGGRLSVNEEALDRENYQYRFVNDKAGRVQRLHDEDWDRVNDPDAKPDADAQGTVRSIHGGIEESGQPYQMVLMRKRKEWYDEDQKEKQAPLEDVDSQLKSGIPQSAGSKDQDLAAHSYVPGGGSSIKVSQGAKA